MTEIAHRVQTAQDQASTIEPITQSNPGFSLTDGYRVAASIQTARIQAGAQFVGRKIGFTNKELWKQFGVDAPIWGAMYDHSVVAATNGKTTFSLAAFSEPRIEPEIALHFHKAPPANATAAELVECIDWVAHGFEIVQSHFPGWRFTAADAVADGSLHGALLLGTPCPIQAFGNDVAAQLEQATVTLSCDGGIRQVGTGANVMGNPLNAVAYLSAELARAGMAPIAAGELITTGSMTAAYAVSPGEQWSSTFEHGPLSGLAVVFQ
ncbi:2-keto-4-pentenoate hydratase [Pollutimonas thiosulfatoxidans]|uniref:Fumarylacetoacetase-like C-terminal domain-containing protein n=1 Tax=Pollutimonas thiosulfatoxidans TaxID=2028345 RepID=A0A410GGC9_9BURK|nr:fumarylacetoacetate hydrolase family protein [Pollutimonas thiosulfatoxidans]QAA95338.1 hypothetical protein CKA81_16820 [Pollutimonas thiosulfatoxidans]